MKTYTVRWEIEVEAENATEAAKLVYQDYFYKRSGATGFDVKEHELLTNFDHIDVGRIFLVVWLDGYTMNQTPQQRSKLMRLDDIAGFIDFEDMHWIGELELNSRFEYADNSGNILFIRMQ